MSTTTATYRKIKNPVRLRVRRVDEKTQALETLERARARGEPTIRAAHGGAVSNSYGYPAQTEGCVTVAWPDGKLWQRVVRVSANKVTMGGVFRAATGFEGLFDHRFGDRKKRRVRKAFLKAVEKDLEEGS